MQSPKPESCPLNTSVTASECSMGGSWRSTTVSWCGTCRLTGLVLNIVIDLAFCSKPKFFIPTCGLASLLPYRVRPRSDLMLPASRNIPVLQPLFQFTCEGYQTLSGRLVVDCRSQPLS